MQRGEIETLADFDAVVAAGGDLSGYFVQSVDLSERAAELRRCAVHGAVFLGCELTSGTADSLRARGGLIFPALPDVPVNPYRGMLYTPGELYSPVPAGHYGDSLDARAYDWSRHQPPGKTLTYTLAASLHDHAITDALQDMLTPVLPQTVVGVMGGHALLRGKEGYREAVELGVRLAASGRLVVSGGGPGAMEAANLGAYLADYSDAERNQAVDSLAAAPTFRDGIDRWAGLGFEVLERYPGGRDSLGIPTWFYGHEPPNVFATHVAKYFSNALREDILLSLCRGGLIYLPGAAGTVQELFQAVTACYYASDAAQIAPLVLVGAEQWTDVLPAWPLLEALAQGRAMQQRVYVVDSIDEAFDALDAAQA